MSIKWERITKDNIPAAETGPFLCTNNASARDAHGRMSHVWRVNMFHASDDWRGPVMAFNDDNTAVIGITHYAIIEPPESEASHD